MDGAGSWKHGVYGRFDVGRATIGGLIGGGIGFVELIGGLCCEGIGGRASCGWQGRLGFCAQYLRGVCAGMVFDIELREPEPGN